MASAAVAEREGTPAVRDNFRRALRGVASTVHVITACDGARRHGMTVTAVMSVTMEPPALVVCLNRSTLLHHILLGTRDFCVNILDEAQEPVSAAFSGAVPPADRFALGSWAFTESGLGYLLDAQASIFCERVATMPYGTHSLIIGEVRDVRFGEREAPLLYHNAAYCTSRPRAGAEF